MIFKFIIIFGLSLTINGCFNVGSGTEIIINGITQEQYEEVKKDTRNNAMKLNPPLDCDSIDASKIYRKENQLVCDYGSLYTNISENNVSIVYAGGTGFWIPTNEIITDKHKKIQKLFIQMAKKYKKIYKKDVNVIFYHDDILPDGKRILF